ncbi:MAG: EamA family transporter RarD [Desulfuromonadaceae bacterium]
MITAGSSDTASARSGVLYALIAYTTWGATPLYFKSLAGVKPLEVLAHRIVWSVALLLILTVTMRSFGRIRQVFRQPRLVATLALTTLLITSNWPVYIYAVQQGEVLQTSLGYFINPLISVLLGCLCLGEKLRPLQWLSILLATAGVAVMSHAIGHLPWISLFLAVSFALYGYLRKCAPVAPLEGLAVETVLVFVPALCYLLYRSWSGEGGFLVGSMKLNLLLPFAGPVTTLPLLLFAAATQRLRLVTVGLMQYISPTLQFLLAVVVFHEPFDRSRLISFMLIWSGLALFAGETLFRLLRTPQDASQEAGTK